MFPHVLFSVTHILVLDNITGLEEIQFELQVEENVALIAVGRETYVAQHFTNDYSLIRRAAGSDAVFLPHLRLQSVT